MNIADQFQQVCIFITIAFAEVIVSSRQRTVHPSLRIGSLLLEEQANYRATASPAI